jgi:fructose-1,6-bisphosphatase I
MSLLMEAAGGKATTGTQRVLDVQPKSIHERVPIFLGSKENVEELESFFKAEEGKASSQQ